MAFTDHSSLFAAVHEDGINRVVRHIMLQRPSLFNYATEYFVQHPTLLCVPIKAAQAVLDAHNPLFKVEDPLPILGSVLPLGLNWCFQFTDFQIDFHPNNTIHLPPELTPLSSQRLALRLKGCFGLDCPPEDFLRELLPRIEAAAVAEQGNNLTGIKDVGFKPPKPQDTVVIPTRELLCFCLELFATAHFEWGTIGGNLEQKWLKVRLDGLEIVDLKPTPMEDSIECYVKSVLKLGLLPRLSVKLEKLVLDITKILKDQGIKVGQKITLQPAPVPAAVPNNPAIEDDQLKVFINLVVEAL